MRLVVRILLRASILTLLLAVPKIAAAESLTLTEPGTFNVLFNGSSNTTNVPELHAEATIHFLGFTTLSNGDTQALFDVSLTNTSTIASRVSGFGFDIDPNATGGSVTGVFTKVILDGSLPNEFGPIEVCVNDGSGESCSGGANGGILSGSSDSFVLTLFFSGAVDTLVLDNFGVRYQSIDGKSVNGTTYKDGSGTGTGTSGPFSPDPKPDSNVPEPGSLLLLGAGLAATLRARYRQRRA